MTSQLDLEQLRKQAKERVRARKAAGRPIKLTEAQLELAREHGFASWPKLKAHVERLGAEQPFHTDLEYYEGRADGIATIERRDRRRGAARPRATPRLRELARAAPPRRGAARRARAADAVRARLPRGRGRRPRAARGAARRAPRARRGCAARTATTCSGWPDGLALVRLLLERGADPNRGNDYGWTKLHQAGYSNRRELAQVMLDAGGRTRRLGARRRRHAARSRRSSGATARSSTCSGTSPATCASRPGSGGST